MHKLFKILYPLLKTAQIQIRFFPTWRIQINNFASLNCLEIAFKTEINCLVCTYKSICFTMSNMVYYMYHFACYIRGQIYFNIALVLQDEWHTIFIHPANTWTCPLKVYAIKSIYKELYAIWLPRVILPKALVLQDECFGKNYSSFLDFTCNYVPMSGIFVPCTSKHHTECDHPFYVRLVHFSLQMFSFSLEERTVLLSTLSMFLFKETRKCELFIFNS